MKCLFCQSELVREGTKGSTSICNTCQVTYFFSLHPTLGDKLLMYGFRVYDPDYDLIVVQPDLSGEGSNVFLQKRYKCVAGRPDHQGFSHKHVLAIKIPPESVTPDNAKYWINRLVNLKVFS